MKNKIFYVYLAFLVFFIGLTAYIGVNFSVIKSTTRNGAACTKVTDYTCTIYEEGEGGFEEATAVYEFALNSEILANENIAIYTSHQNIKLVIDGEEVFSMSHNDADFFGQTSGKQWSFIALTADDAGKTATLYVTSPFHSKVSVAPTIYSGEKENIYRYLLTNKIPNYIIALLIFMVGLVLVGFWAYNAKSYGTSLSTLCLGLFAILFSVWFSNGIITTPLVINNTLLCTYVAYFSLTLLIVPFTMYVADILNNPKDFMASIICIYNITAMAASIILQFTNVISFRKTLYLTHVGYAFVFIWFGIRIVQRIRKTGLTADMRLQVGGIGVLLLAMVIDVTRYYLVKTDVTLIFMAIAILLYVLVLGVHNAKGTFRMIQRGKLVDKYEKMAYRDQLTGLFNRTAYAQTLNNPMYKEMQVGVVMFDLNDLKKCNDLLGHSAGDTYIKTSAAIILEAFKDLGNCYRIGGDEFCAIINENAIHQYDDAIALLNKRVAEFNDRGDFKFNIQIAYGLAIFDETMDADLNETSRRADSNMYQCKFSMKAETATAAAAGASA